MRRSCLWCLTSLAAGGAASNALSQNSVPIIDSKVRRGSLVACHAEQVDIIATQHAPSTKVVTTQQATLFGLTYIAYVAIYFARKPVAVVKSTLQNQMGFSVTALGTIDTAMLTCYAVGQFMVGGVVGGIGRTAALVTAFGACGLLTAAFGAANSVTTMSVLWGACGWFAAVCNPLLVLLVADMFPPSMRASAVGLWQTSQQVGGVSANAIASAVMAKQGWRAVFYSSGAIVSVFAPILALALAHLPDTPSPSLPTELASKVTTKSPSTAKGSPLSVPGVTSVGAAYTLVKMSRYCLMFWLPYFFSKRVKMGAAAAALVSTIFDVSGVIGSIGTGFLCDKCYGGRMISLTLPMSLAAGLAFAGWAALCAIEGSSPPLFGGSLHILAMGGVGLLVAAPDGILGGAAARNLCDYAGLSDDHSLAASVSGLINGCGSVGAIVQGVLTAKLVDVAGWEGLFLSLALAMVSTAFALRPAVAVESEAFAHIRA